MNPVRINLFYLHAASWPVEVSLEEAAQNLSSHRCLLSQEVERSGHSSQMMYPRNQGDAEHKGSSHPEVEELVKVMISCEEQADELSGHFGVWQDNPSIAKSMMLVDPLEGEIQESQILDKNGSLRGKCSFD